MLPKKMTFPLIKYGGIEAAAEVRDGGSVHRMADGRTEVWNARAMCVGWMTQASYRYYLRIRLTKGVT